MKWRSLEAASLAGRQEADPVASSFMLKTIIFISLIKSYGGASCTAQHTGGLQKHMPDKNNPKLLDLGQSMLSKA